jgi:hypothetical protein
VTNFAELQQRVDRIRSSSKLSGEYWRIVDRDGAKRFVFLDPPGDIVRLRKHYPGANGESLKRDEWMREVEQTYITQGSE